jgi:hypothetical protein
MNKIFKQVLIISCVFVVIYWFQQKDDKKSKRVRTTFNEKYKLPLLVSSIIGFILNFKLITNLNNDTITEVTIITPVEACESRNTGFAPVKEFKKLNEMSKPFINSNNFGSKTNDLTWFSKNPTDQQIYTDLPDF